MKISIITIALNNGKYIESCIQSVIAQEYHNLEYLVLDGGSTDGTIEIIKRYENKISAWFSQPDNGIYDAMNKGIRMASGDVIGILNSDDMYYDTSVLHKVKATMDNDFIDACYGDLIYVERDHPDRIVRYWKSCPYEHDLVRKGWILPHPTFFVRRKVYERYGLFDLAYPLAADYELIIRFLTRYEIRTKYIPGIMIKMRSGGATNKSLINVFKQNIEILNALKKNKIEVSLMPFFFFKLLLRYQQYKSTMNL